MLGSGRCGIAFSPPHIRIPFSECLEALRVCLPRGFFLSCNYSTSRHAFPLTIPHQYYPYTSTSLNTSPLTTIPHRTLMHSTPSTVVHYSTLTPYTTPHHQPPPTPPTASKYPHPLLHPPTHLLHPLRAPLFHLSGSHSGVLMYRYNQSRPPGKGLGGGGENAKGGGW